MAITRPVSFSYAIIGDGESTALSLDLSSMIAQQGLGAGATPQVILMLQMSDGSGISGVLSGQTINLTFSTPPSPAVSRNITMTLGF